MITIHPAATGLSAVCEPILRALPQWFGIEAANQMYIRDIHAQPTFVAYMDDSPVGFLTLTLHSKHAAEIHIMGVLPGYHRHGMGRALVEAAETHLQQQDYRFLQVKTLSPKHPDEGYKHTRAFYQALGFCWLEEFPDLWGTHNPCLQLVKAL